MLEKNKRLLRLKNAACFSFAGVKACFRTEEAFRQEIIAAIILIPVGLYLGATPAEKTCLIGSLLIVLIVELINTAIERAIDRISRDHHELSKESKDMGSAAVFFSLALAVITWTVILVF